MRESTNDDRRWLPSASKWRRLALCVGSHQLVLEAKRLGQEAFKTSEFAASGIKGHAWLAGEKVDLSESEEKTAVLLRDRGAEQVERIFQNVKPVIKREKRLWLKINNQPALSGRFDLLAVHPGEMPRLALVQDFKFGFTEPDPAENNAQLRILALLVALNIPTLEEVIVQLISGPYGVTEARYSIAELAAVYSEVISLLGQINAPDAPLSPSPEACKYCPAILICPAFKEQMLKPVQEQQLVELPADPEEVSALLDRGEAVIRYVKQVKEFYAQKLTDDPSYSIPGWGMVPGNVLREVTDWDLARARLSEYLPIEQLKRAADYRLGELETALGKVLKIKGKPLRERMNQILKGLYVEKQNASSLKRTTKNQITV